jgi:hypothetical protein
MIKYLHKVTNKLIILKLYTQVKLAQYQGSKGHNTTSDEYSGLYGNEVWECIECYLNLPETPHPDQHPLNCAHICELQQQNEQLLALQVKYPDNYVNLHLDDNVDDIIYYKKDPAQLNWKNCIAQMNGS